MMGSDRIRQDMLFFLIVICLVIGGGLFAPVLSRAEDRTAELQLLFDPNLLRQHVGLTGDYGERPHPPPLPPDTENHYQPTLEDEYY